jgi:serine/threonine protein kinase/Tol biopolymer transport system component
MALQAGARLGPYEILSPLGAGGMGEVYRATDTNLKRQVAIKVLPAATASDPERVARFQREAEVLATLNHPNIAHIHGFEKSDGTLALVMELVEGPTLADRITQGPIPLNEALPIAKQIAEALEAAHEKGIIHRDLKPANIKVRDDGTVKVLDFGLAKLADPQNVNVTASPTATPAPMMTGVGMMLGTPAYMSPEQARGKPVDKRTDIWAFGCVLFEMLSGQRAFGGETMSDTIVALLEHQPGWRALATSTPGSVRRLLRRCLEKQPARRLHDIADARLEIADTLSGTEDGTIASATEPRTERTALSVVLITAIVIIGAMALMLWRDRLVEPPSGPLLSQVTRVTYDAGISTDPALSPDGKLLVYASDRASQSTTARNLDIWVQQVSGGEPIRLTRDLADDYQPAFSPGGTEIAFRSDRNGGGIYVIPTLGGDERLIAPNGRRPLFSPDGQWIAYWTGEPNTSVRAAGSRAFVVRTAGGPPMPIGAGLETPGYPVWSPDGKRVLLRDGGEFSREKWWSVSLQDGSTVETADEKFFATHGLTHPTPVAWVHDPDRIVFATAPDFAPIGSLWEVAVSASTWKLTGIPHQLTLGTGLETTASVAFLENGARRLVFSSRSMSDSIWSLPIGANGELASNEPVRLTDGASDGQPRLSADGRLLFFNSFLSVNPRDWVQDVINRKKAVLTTTPYERKPTPSADGSRVAYQARNPATSKMAVYVIDLTWHGGEVLQPGVPRKISGLDSESCGWPWSWSTSGRYLFYNCPISGPVWRYDTATGANAQVLGKNIYSVEYSPDGRWIAFQKTDTDGSRLFVASFTDGKAAEKDWISVMPDQGTSPQWAAGGNLLYFLSTRDGFSCIWGQRLDQIKKTPTGAPFAVYHSHSSTRSLANVTGFDEGLSVAVNRIAFVLGEQTGNIWMAEWKERK